MIRRDWLQDQIEQFGKVLGIIMAKFLGLKGEGLVTKGIEITNEALKSKLDIDIDLLLEMSYEELPIYLEERKVSALHLEQLIDYLIAMGDHVIDSDPKDAKKIFAKTLEMYQIVDTTSTVFAMERVDKEKHIKTQLGRLQ